MAKGADLIEGVRVDYFLDYLLTPVCLVLAYKRLLAPQFWINIVAFFLAPGVHFFMRASHQGSILEAAMYTFIFFLLFSAIAYGCAKAEDRFVKKPEP